MALFTELPVYKDCYDLLLKIYGLSKNFRKDTRYTLGEGIKKEVFEHLMLCDFLYGSIDPYHYSVTDSRGLCSIGWHVPADYEWSALLNMLNGSFSGPVLKSALTEPDPGGWYWTNTGATVRCIKD